MAIKRTKKTEEVQSLPKQLDELLESGFTASVLHKKFETIAKTHRGEIKEYFEDNADGYSIEVSKSVKTEYGSVILKQRANNSVDTEGLLKALEEGKVTPETLLSIAKFGAEDLKKIGLGSHVTELDPTEYIELRASADFKSEIDAKFGSDEPKPKAKPKAKVVAKPSASESLAKIKAAKKRVGSKSKSAESDLDSILGE